MNERETRLHQLCEQFDIELLYVFGSRAKEVQAWLGLETDHLFPGPSDVDVGVKRPYGVEFPVRQKVLCAIALEDLFGVERVDLVLLPEAGAFLAANIIRGERLYARDRVQGDEYELYILARAGDLAPFELQRQEMILKGEG